MARQIQKIIQDDFQMECFNANALQGFDDVMSITDRLSKADYYLFVDFRRDGDLPISVFTHQEFALARAWGITDIIAFQEKGLKSYGMLSYVLTHPIEFERDGLLDLVKREVGARWNKTFSRNLVCSKLRPPSVLIKYVDHTGASIEHVWNVFVQNRRKDRVALNTVALLYSITNESNKKTIRPDSSYLKWAGQMGYEKSIFPEDEAHFDAFAIRVGEEGIFLHSAADVQRQPIVTERGCYILEYRVFSESFPPVSVRVRIDYRGPIKIEETIQLSETSAEIVS